MKRLYLNGVPTAHLRRANGLNPYIMVISKKLTEATTSYELFTARDKEFVGRILFDAQGDWIYEGNDLTVKESEDMATFIIQLPQQLPIQKLDYSKLKFIKK